MTSTKDNLIEGLLNFAEAGNDIELGKLGGQMLSQVLDGYSDVAADEECTFAFPSMMISSSKRVESFVAIFPTRVVTAWRAGGMFRKHTERTVIDRSAITNVRVYTGESPGVRGATLLDIDAGATHTFALPLNSPGVVTAVQEALA